MMTRSRIGQLLLMAGSAAVVACTTPPAPLADAAQPDATTPAPPPAAPQLPPDTAAQPATQFPDAGAHSNAALTYRIIDAPKGTFGYDILSDGRLFVHQTNLPGMPGNEGCRTREQAEKLAAFVIGKIQKGEMPPSVTPEELKDLNIR